MRLSPIDAKVKIKSGIRHTRGPVKHHLKWALLREARGAGSWASRRGEMVLYEVKGRPWRISISGRSFMRVSDGILGRSQEGIRVLETPSGS